MKNVQIYRTPLFQATTTGHVILFRCRKRKDNMTSDTIMLNILLRISLCTKTDNIYKSYYGYKTLAKLGCIITVYGQHS